MEFITSQEAAEKWGLKLRTVQLYCTNEKIPGAKKIGKQWFIPRNAIRPADGRNKEAKKIAIENSYYYFPCFVYTNLYSDDSSLNNNEKRLLQAQKQTLQGNIVESIIICKELINIKEFPHIIFGAYGTLLYDYLLLGQYSKIMDITVIMNSILDDEKDHTEDYKLINAACDYQYHIDNSMIFRIKDYKLSEMAMPLYQAQILQSCMYTNGTETPSAVRIYDTLCIEAEKNGNMPIAMIIHAILSLLYLRNKFKDKAQIHIKEAVRIGCDENLLTLLAKYMVISPMEYKREIYSYAPEKVDPVMTLYQRNNISLKNVMYTSKGAKLINAIEPLDMEYLLLLANDMDNDSIALVMDIPEKDLVNKIKDLKIKLYSKSRSELVSRAKSLLATVQSGSFIRI